MIQLPNVMSLESQEGKRHKGMIWEGETEGKGEVSIGLGEEGLRIGRHGSC